MKCRTGIGWISACGGSGFAGGVGGRVSVDVFIQHDDPNIFVHGRTGYVLLLLFQDWFIEKNSRFDETR